MREKVLAICMSVDDSIDFTSTELMDELNIDIPYEEITPENFNSVDAITSLVERYV